MPPFGYDSRMRVLVTGAAGFIGGWAINELARLGYDVIGTDKVPKPGLIQADITNFVQIKKVIHQTKPDAIVHLAAISGSTGKNEIEQSLRQAKMNFEVNSQGTINICEACRLLNVRKLIYMSSFAVYGRTDSDRLPITPDTPVSLKHAYANSKYMGELAVKTYSEDFGLKSAIFRAPFVAGEHQNERNVLLEFILSAQKGEDLVIFGQGNHVREFLHPVDLVSAFDKALAFLDGSASACETFVVGNTPITINDLAQLVVLKVKRGHVRHLTRTVDRAFNQHSDFAKATKMLKWKPVIQVGEIVERILKSD